jgi:hypothetical protein
VGTVKKGTKGTIIEGPIIKDGIKYWHVRFDDGTEGWVAEDDLEYIERPESNIFLNLLNWLKKLFLFYKYFVVVLCLALVSWIVYLYKGLVRLRQDESKALYPENIPEIKNIDVFVNPQWEKILKNIESVNESDWRLAILEADIMLDTLLNNMGLPGDTMGDKLKAVEKSDFMTVDDAWEAHKIRNQIVHEGVNFMLSLHEAKRVIALYKNVFEEFRII